MDWGLIIFIAIVVGLLALIILAVRKVSRKKASPPTAELEEPSSKIEDGIEPEQLPEEEEDQETEHVEAVPSLEKPLTTKISDRKGEKQRLAKGLAKTRGGFVARLSSLFRGKADLDAALLDQVEEILFTADIGVATSHTLIDSVRNGLSKQDLKEPSAIWEHLKKYTANILNNLEITPLNVNRTNPFVILFVGVNGTGKTTTIGKLASRLKDEGHTVILAAGDTFRAAAVEQLEVWGQRAGCPVVKGKEGADPSSVIIEALKKAQETGANVVIADTAGRLHTKVDLMEELQKIRRSIAKRIDGAPHETFLVLDSTTGQNAITQAKMFKETMDISGIILTKLDGTAKGGVILGICNELKIPVRYIGIGERTEDLREFDPEAFVEALYEDADGGGAPSN